ncbi:MAG: ABC transporter ATP-binding protein [Candidatus Izemoplasmatales bacterium]
MNKLVQLKSIKKVYSSNLPNMTIALDDVNLSFPDKGLFFIVGKSGCGKTSLLNIIALMDKNFFGQYLFCGKDVNNFDLVDTDSFHNRDIGIVFQDDYLVEELSVKKNISLVLELRNLPPFEIDKQFESVTKELEINHLANKRISELSGGERQRVCIARALIKRPLMIIADEPTGNLDSKSAEVVFSILKRISMQCLVIIVSHDLVSAKFFSDNIIEIKDGKIVNTSNYLENQNEIILLRTKPEKTKLSFKNSFYFSYKNLVSVKLRFLFTAMVLSLMFCLLFFLSFITLFRLDKSISSYIEQNNIDTISIYKDSIHKISSDDQYFSTVSSGKKILNNLAQEDIAYLKLYNDYLARNFGDFIWVMGYCIDIGSLPATNGHVTICRSVGRQI